VSVRQRIMVVKSAIRKREKRKKKKKKKKKKVEVEVNMMVTETLIPSERRK